MKSGITEAKVKKGGVGTKPKSGRPAPIKGQSTKPKMPTIDECYIGIRFPSDERDCAMFIAGIAECYKFIDQYKRK